MWTLSAFRREFLSAIREVVDVSTQVVYVTSPEARLREAVYLGDSVDADIEDPHLKTGVRTRDIDTAHYVEIQVVRSYPEDAEVRADEIYEQVMTVVSDPDYMTPLCEASGILWILPLSYSLSTQVVDEGSVMCTIHLTVVTRARRQ